MPASDGRAPLPGAYQLRVHIIEGCDLKSRDHTGTSDPVVHVILRTSDNGKPERKSTDVKTKDLNPCVTAA